MKKFLSLLLSLCLLLGALPMQVLALPGSIFPSEGAVKTVTLDDGSLSLQNEYIYMTFRKLWGTYAYLTVAPAAKPDEESILIGQAPRCTFITYEQGQKKPEGVVTEPIKAEFVTKTPNGSANAIKVEYSLLTALSLIKAKATVYYELVRLQENGASSNDTWGVLASVGTIYIDKDSMPQDWNRDYGFQWGYSFNCFTATGHTSTLEKSGGPAIKMSRITVPEGENPQITTENSIFIAPVEDLRTKTVPKGYSSWGDKDGIYITEVYTDGYPWANPFVGLSDYYEQEITSVSGKPIRVALAQTVSVTPGDKPLDTWVQCDSAAYATQGEDGSSEQEEGSGSEYYSHFLWGFHDLIKAGAENVPSQPDTVDAAISAKRLAAFAVNGGVTVEYVADDAALQALKKQYGDPVALISGDYESKNGTEFTFTGGAAMLSPSVTATWNKTGGKLVIKKDGTIEHSGVSLNAPSFKFYQPKNGAENDLQISLTKDGFAFQINPEKNDAIVFVDIPYAAVKLENAKADAAGNLVFSGDIGFRTIFNGAEFSMENLGYGLNTKNNEFKVNGVKATGSFDTAKLMALDLTSISGEVNTFKGEESVYAAGDGSFTVQGALAEGETSDALYIRAQDSAGNLSAWQSALVARQAQTYAVTVTTDGNGTASADLTAAAAGTNISLSATPNAGYHFKEWQVVSGGVTIENDKFTMPDGNVEIKAIFEKDAAPATPAPTATGKPSSSQTPAPAAPTKPNSSPTPAPAATAKPNSGATPAPAATAKPDSSPTPEPTAPAAKPPVWWVMLPIAGGIALAGGFMIFKKKRRR